MATQTVSPQQMLANFDGNATERSIVIASKDYGNGIATFPLPHAGVPTYSILTFTGSLTRTEGTTVGTLTASPYWPFNVMAPSSLVDMAGITRIYADGYDLYELELVKQFGAYPKTPYSSESYADDIYEATLPTGTSGASTTTTINFSVVIPISYTKYSALGSYAATVPNGEAQLQVVEAPLTGSYIQSPLTTTGKTTAKLTGTWSLEYYYLDAPSSVPIPVSALQTVHEVYHQESTTDLSSGTNKDEVLQTGRTYYRVLQRLVEDNASSFLHVNRFQFLVDSSTPTLDETLAAYMARMRYLYGRDMPPGMIVRDFSRRPWSPNNYGSLTARLVLANAFTTGSFSKLYTTRETLYVPSGNLVAIGG